MLLCNRNSITRKIVLHILICNETNVNDDDDDGGGGSDDDLD